MSANRQHIAELVEKYLVQPRSYHLNIRADSIKNDGNWWYVVVQPDHAGVAASDYANRLEAVETKIKQNEHLNVLLVPTMLD